MLPFFDNFSIYSSLFWEKSMVRENVCHILRVMILIYWDHNLKKTASNLPIVSIVTDGIQYSANVSLEQDSVGELQIVKQHKSWIRSFVDDCASFTKCYYGFELNISNCGYKCKCIKICDLRNCSPGFKLKSKCSCDLICENKCLPNQFRYFTKKKGKFQQLAPVILFARTWSVQKISILIDCQVAVVSVIIARVNVNLKNCGMKGIVSVIPCWWKSKITLKKIRVNCQNITHLTIYLIYILKCKQLVACKMFSRLCSD